MGLRELLFGTSESDEDSGRPPKPDVEQDTKRLERTRYEATVEYRNGDVETFECYGIYSRGDTAVKFNTDPHGKRSAYDYMATHSYDRRKINYETLAREPELEELATDTFVLSFTRDWEWAMPRGYATIGSSRDWRETHEDIELTVQRDTGTNTDESE